MLIEGIVENIIFRNKDNGYSVLLVNAGKAFFTVVGNVTSVNVGENIKVEATEVFNEMYGKQYKIDSYSVEIPNSSKAIEKFLASSEFKGIGKVTANKIVSIFGEKTIETIIDNPEKLLQVSSLNNNKINLLRNKILDRKNELDYIMKLSKYGLTLNQISKIIDKYKENSLQIIENSPFKIAIEVEGIGFLTCDNIAKINGIKFDDEERIKAGIIYILENENNNGNVYVEKSKLIKSVINLLDLKEDFDFEEVLYNMQIDLQIYIKLLNKIECCFLKSSFTIENKLSKMLYDLRDNITIITGGPGTGKTYNIKKYLNEAFDRGLSVLLCAPTGRAAKRIKEVTNCDAKTIHRLLECVPSNNGDRIVFNKNEDNKLNCDLLIVDEMSMVDEVMMYHLIKAVNSLTKIVLVGDVDQLPSVGSGQVLKDMINSNLFNVIRLTEVHRQSDNSNIILNAHLVNTGKNVDLSIECSDFKFIRKNMDEKISEAISTLVNENIPKFFNISNDQIQVISVSKKGICGTENLNNVLQKVLNPDDYTKAEIKIGNIILREGDKIIQCVNNYDIPFDCINDKGVVYDSGSGIFNGDIGEIIEIDNDEKAIVAKFDERIAYYSKNDIVDLNLAYAITVHKSQGSEYDVVVMPIYSAPFQLLNRKILYTAMTRAKKCICFVGYEKIFFEMINNKYEAVRNSALCDKLYLNV